MIEGLNIRCNVGPVEILRSPFLELVFRRCAVLSRATVHVPDPEGEVRSRLAVGQAVAVRWGYRGEAGMWQEWEGTVEGIDQPRRDADGADAVVVRAVGLEKALTTTTVTESFYREPADVVARRLLARTGLAVGAVEVPGEVLPWQVFSGVSVARAVKQLSHKPGAIFRARHEPPRAVAGCVRPDLERRGRTGRRVQRGHGGKPDRTHASTNA